VARKREPIQITTGTLGNRSFATASVANERGRPVEFHREGSTAAEAASRLILEMAREKYLLGREYEIDGRTRGTIEAEKPRARRAKQPPPDPLKDWGPYRG